MTQPDDHEAGLPTSAQADGVPDAVADGVPDTVADTAADTVADAPTDARTDPPLDTATDTAADTVADQPPARRIGRGRRALLVVLFLLTCVSITTATVVTWVHQVALNTDRWVAVVGPVGTNPAVIAATSDRVSAKVVDVLDVQARLEARLPAPLAFVAVPITQALQDQIRERMATAMATPAFEQAWLAANRVAHQSIVKILRGQSESVVIVDGYVRLDVWPLIGIALTQLQTAGVIPAGVALPDLSQGLPEGAGSRLEQTLGITLPPDFGTIPLVKADRLEAAQQVVRIFDIVTVGLILITILLALVTVWYAPRRLRMVVYLAVGGVVSVLIGRFALGVLEDAIVSSLTDANTATTVRSVLDVALADLYGFSRIVVLGGIVVAVVAVVAGRPAWLMSVAGSAGSTTRQAAAGAGAIAGSAVSQAPSSQTTGDWARLHRRELRLAGLAVIGFIVAWAAMGIEIALLAFALIALVEIGIGLLGGREDDAPDA
jgi:hypothetical protein